LHAAEPAKKGLLQDSAEQWVGAPKEEKRSWSNSRSSIDLRRVESLRKEDWKDVRRGQKKKRPFVLFGNQHRGTATGRGNPPREWLPQESAGDPGF